MKKDYYEFMNKIQTKKLPAFPFSNDEIRSIIASRNKSTNQSFKLKRGIKMTSIIASILMLGIFGINYLSNDQQPATAKQQTAKVQQENTTKEEKREVTSAIESEKVEPEKKRAVSLSFDNDNYDYVASDTMPSVMIHYKPYYIIYKDHKSKQKA